MSIIVRRTFHVHPDGDDANGGRTWEEAVATFSRALALVTSGRGDRIMLAPSSTPYVAANITKDYVTVEAAVPGGYARPDISAASGPVVTGQGFVAKGIRFVGTGGIALTIRGNGFHVEDCVLEGAGDDALLLEGDVDDDSYTASEGKILNNLFRDSAYGIRFKNPGPTAGVGITHCVVEGNRFLNITNEDIVDEDTAGSNGSTFQHSRCWNFHLDRNKAAYVDLTAGTGTQSGQVGGRFNVDTGLTSAHVALPSGIVAVGCYDAVGLVDTSAF